MQPVNNVGAMNKKQAKKMKKMIEALQKELSAEILSLMQAYGKPMDIEQIVDAYPDNARRQSCKNRQELKQYVSIGLGSLIQDGKLKELPRAADGRFYLEIVSE